MEHEDYSIAKSMHAYKEEEEEDGDDDDYDEDAQVPLEEAL